MLKVGKLSFVAPGHEKLNVTSTAVYVSVDGKFAGYITLKDKMRPESPKTIERLRRQGAEDIMMLNR